MASRSVVFGGLEAAARFLGPAWREAWGAMTLAGAVLYLCLADGLLFPKSPWRFLALLAILALVVLVQGALYRRALGLGRKGVLGVYWGAAEWRLGAVWGLTFLFLLVLGMLAFVVLLSFAFAIASSGPGFILAQPMTWARGVDQRGRVIMAVVGAGCLAGMIWASIRVSLAAAATVALGRVQVLASWPTTRGRVLATVFCRLVLAIPVVAIIAIHLTNPSADTPGSLWSPWLWNLIVALTVMGFWLPLNVGLMTFFYQRAPET